MAYFSIFGRGRLELTPSVHSMYYTSISIFGKPLMKNLETYLCKMKSPKNFIFHDSFLLTIANISKYSVLQNTSILKYLILWNDCSNIKRHYILIFSWVYALKYALSRTNVVCYLLKGMLIVTSSSRDKLKIFSMIC